MGKATDCEDLARLSMRMHLDWITFYGLYGYALPLIPMTAPQIKKLIVLSQHQYPKP